MKGKMKVDGYSCGGGRGPGGLEMRKEAEAEAVTTTTVGGCVRADKIRVRVMRMVRAGCLGLRDSRAG